ncbi:MAG: winged helix-turn-helix transcriptional regulator [Methanosarcinales archaeon]
MEKIKNILRANPQGLWIREIARKTKISKSTVHLYVNKYLADELENTMKVKGNLIRFVRLKKWVKKTEL